MAADKYWYVDQDLSENKEKENQPSHIDDNFTISDPENIIVSLIPEFGTMSQLVLSVQPEGKYTFNHEKNEKIRDSLYIQPYKGKWYLYAIKPVYLVAEGDEYVSYVEIEDQKLISIKNVNEKCFVFMEYVSKNSNVNHNYRMLNKTIKIGKSDCCDIIYKSNFVSAVHAEIHYSNNQWKIVASNQEGFFFINGGFQKNTCLNVGDTIFIMGLKLIIGIGFIAINDLNERVRIQKQNLYRINHISEGSFFDNTVSCSKSKEVFNRLPRRRVPLNEKEIRIEAPPMQLNGEKIPLLLRMGGSMVMSASSMLMGNYTMMISSVLFPVLNSKYTDKQKKEYEQRRKEKYEEYLQLKETEIENERLHEEEVLNYNYPELEKVLLFPEDGNRLWERRKNDDDFLNIRLGYGNIPLLAKYKYPEERFSLDEDPLENEMYELVNKKVSLNNVPIMHSFVDNHVCGILGTKGLVLSFIKRLLMQIIISHSYDEVKTVFLINDNDLKELDFIKYIPHIWDDEKTFRFLATNTTEAFQICEYLKKEFDEDLDKLRNMKLSETLKKRPYYFIFAIEKKLFDSMEVLKDIMQLEENCGVSVVTAFDDLPKECLNIFQLNSNGENSIVHLKEVDRENLVFHMDRYNEEIAVRSMKQLANTSLKVVLAANALPKMITFLEMFGVGKVEHLNPLQRWKEHNPIKSLATPIGIGTDGSLFELDLHQKFQGPHGLIAGMTGSGKSEFIITYILSLAINFHPDEVAFLLIDYKGGGLTSAFEDEMRGIYLPHLVGTITNLDGAAITRSLISIQSEMTRRQRLFNNAKSKVGESSIDIYSYQQLYRNGQVEEPLPHLFIIADEFAEMKQQQPEFMESLISIARIGRSLGVHLILATQKPSGVVNDQIRSNTKFRVCLKVQDRTDSLDMLKRPEGAEIKETGRFYLQVGYNEYFAMGQSAWAGADYEEQEELIIRKDDSIVFIDTTGQKICETKPDEKKMSSGKSQLTEIVRYLSKLAEVEHITPKKLWKEPLSEKVDYSSAIPEKGNGKMSVFVGQVDDPEKQIQYAYFYDFLDCHNILIVGEGKCGKTTMIQNMLLQLTMYYGIEDVNYYILDYSSHMFKLFRNTPHCGAVLTEEDDASVKPLFDLFERVTNERKKLFSELEVDNFKSAKEKIKLPLILVVIDNISGMMTSKAAENYYYNMNTLIKNMTNYGIRFIISCSHLNEVATRIRQEIGDTFTLTMKDKYEYQDALGCKIGYIPPSFPGRGLVNIQGEALEMQGCMTGAELNDNQRIAMIKDLLSKVKDVNDNNIVRRLPSFTNDETYIDFSKQFPRRRIPLGYSITDAKAVALPFKQFHSLPLYFGNKLGIIPILENILMRADYEEMSVLVIARMKDSVFLNSSRKTINEKWLDEIHTIPCEQDQIYEEIKNILLEMMNEKHYLEEYCKDQGKEFKLNELPKDFANQVFPYICDKIKPRLIIIENVKDLCSIANDEVVAVMNGLCVTMALYNTYIIPCYEPGNATRISDHLIHQSLTREEMALLFGGCYDRQGLVELDHKFNNIRQVTDYNLGIMKYRGNIYSLMMPCGELIKESIDEDDISIF